MSPNLSGVWTIPSGVPFLERFVQGLERAAAKGAIEDALILAPSRRACLALEDAFVEARGGAPSFLPEIRPLGEVDPGELALGGALEAAIAPTLRPAIEPLRRQLLLTKLVAARAEDEPTPHDRAFRLAQALAAFLDDIENEGAELSALDRIDPGAHAAHWERNLRFLMLLRDFWPAILEEEGALDPARRLRAALEAAAAAWPDRARRWTILLGVTGHVPAVARFAGALMRDKGATLIAPGLDLAMSDAAWDALGDPLAARDKGWAQHPQWALKRLLGLCGSARADVRIWPDGEAPPAAAARNALARRALAPPAAPPEPAPALDEATEGLRRIEAPDLASEAKAIALLLRESLERADERAALVTPDRNLARRVAVELGRFGLRVDDSAGRPLDQTAPGGFLLLAAHAAVEGMAPADLLAFLKHPFASCAMARPTFRRMVRALELRLLRGPRIGGGVPGLRAALARRKGRGERAEEDDALDQFLARLEDASRDVVALTSAGEAPLDALAAAHLAFVERMAASEDPEIPSPLWALEAGKAAAAFAQALRRAAEDYGPIPVSAFPSLLAVAMGGIAVRPGGGEGHPRLRILGRFEARLAAEQRVVLGGMNDDVWPDGVDAGPWLNRPLRAAIGMPPVEQRTGFAAHDWTQALGAKEVFLTRSRKDQTGQPTTPSRWLSRLDAVLREDGGPGLARIDDPRWLAWANALDRPAGDPEPCARPTPRPPVARRPRRLSVTDVTTLMRDPYAIYAKRILGLGKLDPVDDDPGAPERGQLVHAALEAFVRAFPKAMPEDAETWLLERGGALLAQWDDSPEVAALWRPRFEAAARWFVAWERARRGGLDVVHAERSGALLIETARGPFELIGRADRIERRKDGEIAIADYKTGDAPGFSKVVDGVAKQLPLEAVLARGGGFDGVAAAPIAELFYVVLKGGEPAGDLVDPTRQYSKRKAHSEPEALAEDAARGLVRLIDAYDDPNLAYAATPLPAPARGFDDYAHLARAAEWLGARREP